MRVRIHRGAHEIGGSCVEVEAAGSRLVLDVGRPLSAQRSEAVPLPAVPGLADADASVAGVVISHSHQDHWGLVGQVSEGVPLVMGEPTHRILTEAAFWTSGLTVKPSTYLEHRRPIDLGPFRVTPYLNDHSAFDAYSVLVEAEGRRLFYSGDIRGHGRKAAIFEHLLRDPPTDVDVLLMEGTNIRPNEKSEDPLTETAVEERCASRFRAAKGMGLTLFSAQNMDRLVTLYRAALRSDRDLVMDLYTASIAKATGNSNIPHPDRAWPKVHVYVPRWQRVKVKEAEQFWRVDEIKEFRLFEEDLASDRGRFALRFDLSAGPPLEKAGALEHAVAIWSMWTGYLAEPSGERLTKFLTERGIDLVIEHTSGHASIPDLQRLAGAIAAKRVVPIHSFGAHRYSDYFERVEQQPDGVWWDV